MLIRRRFSLLMLPAVLLASFAGAGPVQAAHALVADGNVRVTFVRSAPGGDIAGDPLGGAVVELAVRDGTDASAPLLQELTATTDSAGRATFSGVIRSTDASEPAFLALRATALTVAPLGACEQRTTWSAALEGVESRPTVAVELVGHASVDASCPELPPPDGVALDADLAVTVASGSGIPIPGASVTLTALADGEPFQTLAATTDDDGRAELADVGRSLGTQPITLVVSARRTDHLPLDGCTFSQFWSGSERYEGIAPVAEIALTVALTSSIACAPPGSDAPTLTGVVVDESGNPVAVRTGSVTMVRSDGARWTGPLEPDPGGGFRARVHAWGTDEEPALLELRVQGGPTGQRVDGDCTYTIGPVGTYSTEVILAYGFDPDPVTVEAITGELEAVCGATSTQPPGGGAAPSGSTFPSITLPPTDADSALTGPSHAPLLPGLVATLGVFALLLGWALVARDT